MFVPITEEHQGQIASIYRMINSDQFSQSQPFDTDKSQGSD
jgi:hypothetical protein